MSADRRCATKSELSKITFLITRLMTFVCRFVYKYIFERYFIEYITDCITSTQTQKKTNGYTSKEYQSADFQTKQRPGESSITSIGRRLGVE